MNFEFEIFHKEGYLTVYFNEYDSMDIPMMRFFRWVESKNLNHWIDDYYDAKEPDRHGQQTGDLSYDEYFKQPYEKIKINLAKYLDKNNE